MCLNRTNIFLHNLEVISSILLLSRFLSLASLKEQVYYNVLTQQISPLILSDSNISGDHIKGKILSPAGMIIKDTAGWKSTSLLMKDSILQKCSLSPQYHLLCKSSTLSRDGRWLKLQNNLVFYYSWWQKVGELTFPRVLWMVSKLYKTKNSAKSYSLRKSSSREASEHYQVIWQIVHK